MFVNYMIMNFILVNSYLTGTVFQINFLAMEAEETMECIQEFPEHYKVILDRLNEQREQDQFTDITLIVDGMSCC